MGCCFSVLVFLTRHQLMFCRYQVRCRVSLRPFSAVEWRWRSAVYLAVIVVVHYCTMRRSWPVGQQTTPISILAVSFVPQNLYLFCKYSSRYLFINSLLKKVCETARIYCALLVSIVYFMKKELTK